MAFRSESRLKKTPRSVRTAAKPEGAGCQVHLVAKRRPNPNLRALGVLFMSISRVKIEILGDCANGSARQIEKTGDNGNWDKTDAAKVEDDGVEGQCAKLVEFDQSPQALRSRFPLTTSK